uniref:Peroxisomal membrane protein PEX14-like KPWE domain-containing protein n=1 Tax=Labrus bergylta TaxID=56723 RepID=A0A3Q3MFM3_9LABR
RLDQGTFSDPDSDISENQTAEMEVKPLSFAEVMKLVQEGKEVPGVKQLDVKPTNQSPTPSHMDRILKPWELSSSSLPFMLTGSGPVLPCLIELLFVVMVRTLSN